MRISMRASSSRFDSTIQSEINASRCANLGEKQAINAGLSRVHRRNFKEHMNNPAWMRKTLDRKKAEFAKTMQETSRILNVIQLRIDQLESDLAEEDT